MIFEKRDCRCGCTRTFRVPASSPQLYASLECRERHAAWRPAWKRKNPFAASGEARNKFRDRVLELLQSGMTHGQAADAMNREGMKTPLGDKVKKHHIARYSGMTKDKRLAQKEREEREGTEIHEGS